MRAMSGRGRQQASRSLQRERDRQARRAEKLSKREERRAAKRAPTLEEWRKAWQDPAEDGEGTGHAEPTR
jgi:hypothetical protein